MNTFDEYKNNDINDQNGLVILKQLLDIDDIESIVKLMSDYNIMYSPYFYKEANKLIVNSKFESEINSGIRGRLGIFG